MKEYRYLGSSKKINAGELKTALTQANQMGLEGKKIDQIEIQCDKSLVIVMMTKEEEG